MWWRKKKKTPPLLVLIQGSLQPRGLTDVLFQEAVRILFDQPVAVVTIDVRNRHIDFYDTRPSEQYSVETRAMLDALSRARGCFIAMPVYSAKISGAVNDFLTFVAPALKGKVASLACVGTSAVLYPASVSLVRLLHDTYGVSVVTPVVRASPESFRDDHIFDEQVAAVLNESLAALVKSST